MSFDYYHEFYGNYLGIRIRGALSKKYIYQVVHGQQRKYPYVVPGDPKSPGQLKMRDLLKKAVQSWHSLSGVDQDLYRSLKLYDPPMTGFNYYISTYIKLYI